MESKVRHQNVSLIKGKTAVAYTSNNLKLQVTHQDNPLTVEQGLAVYY